MKQRKWFAWLMTVVMLIGMVPLAQAEVIACNHNWAWRWPDGQPTNCQDWKWCEEYCTLCGEGNGRFEQCGECQPGAWYWDGNPPANCNEWGIQNQACSVCGEVFNEREVRGDHQWGGYTPVEPAGCETPGEEVIQCAVCGERGDLREIPALGHDWGEWKWEIEATCNQEGLRVRYCNRCNMREEQYVPGGEHQYGAWMVDRAPTCTKRGLKYKRCSVCGDTQWLYIEVTDHDMGEWYVFEAPQVGVVGIERSDCLNECGYFETREIPALELESAVGLELTLVLSSAPANGTHFVVGEEVTFTENWANGTGKTLYPFSVSVWTCGTPVFGSEVDQISSWFAEDAGGPVAPGATGSHTLTVIVTEADVARGAIYAMAELLSTVHNGADLENVTTPFVTAPCGEGKLGNSDGVHLEKFIRNAPANGKYYVPGEVLNYALTLILDDGLLLDDAAIYDPIIDNDGLVISYGKGLYGSMGMDVFYTVTEEDAQRGYVENTAYATWIYSDSGKAGYCESETVIAPCGVDNSGDYGLSAGLSVTKTVTSTPDNGSYYEPGEIIFFEITATNTSTETLTNLTFHDPLISDAPGATVPVFAPGEAASFQAFYPVTDVDAFAGSVTNIAYVTAADAEGHQVVEYSNSVTVPCGHTFLNITPTPQNPFGIFQSLAIVKKEESLPLNGQYYTVGEVIHYTITYTNDGELPLTDVEIWDMLDASAPIAHAELLQPGESRTCYFQYTVMPADAAFGTVMNMAQASYIIPGGAGYASSYSNVVISAADAYEQVWVELPIFPKPGEDPEYDPSFGWFPPEEESETPDFGTIDTDALHGGDSYCVRTITGRDNASASYEISFCAEHADTQTSALLMRQAAVTPEMQIQAAAYAVALWRAEVETLYQEIINASDPAAKTVVMTEYVRFLTDMANYEAVLKLLYPDQPALAAQLVADMWEDKCVTLCYEMHAPASERKDDLLRVTPAAGAASVTCDCVTISEGNAARTYKQQYCPQHSFTFSMMDALLQGKNTAEAWTMVRQIWGVELTNAYNQLSAKLGSSSALAMAEYNTLTQWLMAREATLIALYPDHPELVAQTMVKTIMDRVNALCLNGK